MQIKLNSPHQSLVQFYFIIITLSFRQNEFFFFSWCLFKHFINLNSFSSCSGGKDNTEKWKCKLDPEDPAAGCGGERLLGPQNPAQRGGGVKGQSRPAAWTWQTATAWRTGSFWIVPQQKVFLKFLFQLQFTFNMIVLSFQVYSTTVRQLCT